MDSEYANVIPHRKKYIRLPLGRGNVPVLVMTLRSRVLLHHHIYHLKPPLGGLGLSGTTAQHTTFYAQITLPEHFRPVNLRTRFPRAGTLYAPNRQNLSPFLRFLRTRPT